MEQSFTVAPGDFQATLSSAPPSPGVDTDPLSAEQQAAVSAVWDATKMGVAAQYEVSFASSDEGGWTVVRVAAVHKAE